jgi:hypothetical protein
MSIMALLYDMCLKIVKLLLNNNTDMIVIDHNILSPNIIDIL